MNLQQHPERISQNKQIKNQWIDSDTLGRWVVTVCAGIIIVITFAMIGFVTMKCTITMRGTDAIPLGQILFSPNWNPDVSPAEGGPQFGASMFIVGSLVVAGLGILLSAPLAIAAAIFTVEIAPQFGERFLRPALEIFTGIPSVVYGWVGLSVLVPFIRNYIGGMGFSILAASIVLAIMTLPSIATLTIDALRSLPASFRAGSLALGATRWQTIKHVILPAVKVRLGMAVTLGLTRALGEALAVQMVLGNSVQWPKSILHSASTITSVITMDMSNTMSGSPWNNVLWTLAWLLLLITMGLILLIRYMSRGNSRGVH